MTPVPAFAAHVDVWLVLGGLIAIYLYAVIRVGPLMVEKGSRAATGKQIGSFLAGVGVLWLASDWPVHDIAEQSLYSVHMAQHMAITLVAPPLLLAGTPRWLAEVLIPKRVLPFVRAICAPVPALLISIAVLIFTHWPAVVTLAVTSGPAHFALHALALASAIVMWMPILSPTPLIPRARPLVQIGYLFAQSIIPTIPASFLTFGTRAALPGLRRRRRDLGHLGGHRPDDGRVAHEDRRRPPPVGMDRGHLVPLVPGRADLGAAGTGAAAPHRLLSRATRLAAGIALTIVVACSGQTTVVGSVIEVDGDLSTVESFTMVTEDGETLTFEPDPFGRYPFPLPHLREHLVSGQQLRVDYRPAEDGTLVAVALDDADGGHG